MTSPSAPPTTRAVAKVGVAALLAQVIGVAVAPIASRLYGDAAFGVFGLWFGLANVLVPFVLLGLPDAIVAADRDTDADALLGDALRLVLVGAPLSCAVTWAVHALPASGYQALPVWAVGLMWPEVAAVALVMLLQAWSIRRLRFGALATSHVTQAGVRAGLQVGAGSGGGAPQGLFIAEIGGRLFTVGTLAWHAWPDVRRAWRVPIAERRATRRTFRRFAISRTPSVVLNNFGTALPQMLITALYGLGAGGQYALLATTLAVPAALVQKAVGDVFIGTYATLRRDDRPAAAALLRRTAGQLGALSLLPAVTLLAAGPWLFAAVFGSGWREAGELAQRMAPAMAADLAIGPLGGVLNVANRPERKLWFDVVRLGGIGGAYALASALHRPVSDAVLLQAIATCVAYGVYALAIRQADREP